MTTVPSALSICGERHTLTSGGSEAAWCATSVHCQCSNTCHRNADMAPTMNQDHQKSNNLLTCQSLIRVLATVGGVSAPTESARQPLPVVPTVWHVAGVLSCTPRNPHHEQSYLQLALQEGLLKTHLAGKYTSASMSSVLFDIHPKIMAEDSMFVNFTW